MYSFIMNHVELHLGLGPRSRFDFGSKFYGVSRNFFFSDSQHTFVKGTKDSNKAFLKAQVREGIGTMYLFLIVPHLVST